jgi:hypothetical protein
MDSACVVTLPLPCPSQASGRRNERDAPLHVLRAYGFTDDGLAVAAVAGRAEGELVGALRVGLDEAVAVGSVVRGAVPVPGSTYGIMRKFEPTPIANPYVIVLPQGLQWTG